MIRLLRFWVTFETPVKPRTYLTHGLSLMAVKYAGDVPIVWLFAGTTWYELDMAPHVYWKMYADHIIHRIHLRVLEHIRTAVERS